MEPTVSSETSAIRIQTPGNYPKRNTLHLEHGKSLKTRRTEFLFLVNQPTDRLTEQTTDQPTKRSTNRSTDRTTDQPTDNPQPTNKPTNQQKG